MGDAVKIAVKTALIAVITAGILALFTVIQIPILDFSVMSNGLSTALAIAYHWCPVLQIIFPACLVILGVKLAIKTFEVAAIAYRWVMKVNE